VTLDEFRQQNPAYKDWDDARLADGLYNKFYSSMPREEFDKKVGYKAAPVRSAGDEAAAAVPRGIFKGTLGTLAEFARAGQMEDEQRALAFDIPGSKPTPEIPTGEAAIKTFGKATGVELPPEPKTKTGKFAEAGISALSNPISYLGPGGWSKPVAALTSSLASEGAGQMLERSGLEMPARLIASVVGGSVPSVISMERNLARLNSRLPLNENIEAGANAGYGYLEQSNTRISPQATEELAAQVHDQLYQSRHRDYLEPSVFKAVEELRTGQQTSVGAVDTVRKLLNRIAKSKPDERDAANRAINAIDEYLINIPQRHILSGNPAADAEVLRFSQRSWAVHKQLDMLEEASTRAQRRSDSTGTAANRINTTRQEIRKIIDSDKKSRGLSDQVKEKMEQLIAGTWLSNLGRSGSKYAPHGPVSAMPALATAATVGVDAGASVAAAGFLSKWFGEYLTDRQLQQIEVLIRSESPTGRPVAREIAPLKREQEIVPLSQAARSALTSPLAPGASP
jgi:hypothetical protein